MFDTLCPMFKRLMVMLAVFAVAGHAEANPKQLSGMVKVDGSSTVFPITEAMAEEFQRIHPRVRVTVGLSGTGG